MHTKSFNHIFYTNFLKMMNCLEGCYITKKNIL